MVAAGVQTVEISFALPRMKACQECQEWTPRPAQRQHPCAGSPFPIATAQRQSLGLGLLDGETIVGSVLERGRTSDPGRLTVVTERIRIDDSALIDNACARLPSDARSIRPEERLRDLAGEPYRFICKLAARE